MGLNSYKILVLFGKKMLMLINIKLKSYVYMKIVYSSPSSSRHEGAEEGINKTQILYKQGE